VEFSGGSFTVRGTDKGVPIQQVAFAAFDAHNLPEGVEPGIDAEATFDPVNFSLPHGTHLCAADVDTETGRTAIRRYVCVDDVGRVVNPLIVEGQVHGGVAQGIAQALYEGARHDESGTLTTGTFADYLLPSAPDLPPFTTDRTETPSTDNQLGVKGVGETGTIAATPAVVNAIVDALRPWGVDDVEMPATPQRVWRAIQDKESAESSADLPLGAPDDELEPGARLEEGDIGIEAAEEHIAGEEPKRSPRDDDETGGAR
jgi:carbon-monoxide dehydrogenase large subunit